MSTVNNDLQATHQLLTLLEQSKRRSDEVLDGLPGIYSVIEDNDGGRILKGNLGLANLFEIDPEDLSGKALSTLFTSEAWHIFRSQVAKLESSPLIEFELNIFSGEKEKIYYWQLARFEANNYPHGKLISVLSRDITELRRAERQLAEIFATIPLGICSIDSHRKIENKYSIYLEYLVGQTAISGRSFKELFLTPIEPYLTTQAREAFITLLGSIGQEEMIFDSVRTILPSEVFYPLKGASEEDGRYFGLKFHPITYDGKVTRLLVVVEDRTALVIARKREEKNRLMEEKSVARILHLKKACQEMLPFVMEELTSLSERLRAALQKQLSADCQAILHGIKGNARVAGFEYLKEMSHEIENDFKAVNEGTAQADWTVLTPKFEALFNEWEELHRLHFALYGEQSQTAKVDDSQLRDSTGPVNHKAIKLFREYNQKTCSYSPRKSAMATRLQLLLASDDCTDLKTLGELMALRVRETAKPLGKEVDFEFHAQDVFLNESCQRVLSEALLHIINNSLAHGIETPEERRKAGKSERGLVHIHIRESYGVVECTIDDDGRGILLDKVKKVAIKRGLITEQESQKMTPDEMRQLIFKPGFSTAEQVGELAGRGVGMDAVQQAIGQLKGEIIVSEGSPCGTRVTLRLQASSGEESSQSTYSFRWFCNAIDQAIYAMNVEDDFQIQLTTAGLDDETMEKAHISCDLDQIILALSSCVGNLGKAKKVQISLSQVDRLVLFDIQAMDFLTKSVRPNERAEYILPAHMSKRIMQRVDGKVLREGAGHVTLGFGQILLKGETGVSQTVA